MGGEDLYGSLSVDGTFRSWGKIRNDLGIPDSAVDAFGITALIGDVNDLPVPIVARYEMGWYTDGGNPPLDHNYYRGGVGVRAPLLTGP